MNNTHAEAHSNDCVHTHAILSTFTKCSDVPHTNTQSTHAEAHSEYKLKLIDLFEIQREGEAQRFEKYESLHNRQLLWHGARLTDWSDIFLYIYI